jgi:hypothetical protein
VRLFGLFSFKYKLACRRKKPENPLKNTMNSKRAKNDVHHASIGQYDL